MQSLDIFKMILVILDSLTLTFYLWEEPRTKENNIYILWILREIANFDGENSIARLRRIGVLVKNSAWKKVMKNNQGEESTAESAHPI